MNRAGRAVLLTVAVGLPGLAPMVAKAADPAATVEWGQCSAISAADARLACYDTLAGRATVGAAPKIAAVGAAAVPAPIPATAPAVSPAAKPAPTIAATTPLPPPVPTEDPRNFGYSATQLITPEQKAGIVQAIEAHVAQVATDQLRSRYVALDNGQTWISTSGDMNLSVGEAITIKRAALGSYMLISASHDSYHVRRVR